MTLKRRMITQQNATTPQPPVEPRIAELEAEVARLKGRNACFTCQQENEQLKRIIASHETETSRVSAWAAKDRLARAEAEAKLARVEALPETWRKYDQPLIYPQYAECLIDCADELEAKLK